MRERDSSAPDRNAALDGLRALAALSVLLFHVWLYRTDRPHGARPHVLDKVMFQLNTGLVCFFVLSGFLLYSAFVRAVLTGRARSGLGAYALRRAARIVPAYYVCCAASLLLFAAVGFDQLTPDLRLLPVYAMFAQNYSMTTIAQVSPVAWTLCVEVAFYALLPLIALAAARLGRRPRAQVALLLAITATSITWNIVIWKHGSPPLLRQALPAYLGTFAAGMLVAVWVQSRRLREARPVGPAATAGLVLCGVALVLANGYWHETSQRPTAARGGVGLLVAAAGFALLIAAIAAGSQRSRVVRWLAWRPLVAIGIVSYGLYLWHLPVLLAIREVGLLPHDLLPRALVVLAASLVLAAASWHWVEKPCLTLAHRRRTSKRALDPLPEPATTKGRIALDPCQGEHRYLLSPGA